MAVPLALENSLWYASNIISTIFIGHLGKQELASVVLGESVFNVTGLHSFCSSYSSGYKEHPVLKSAILLLFYSNLPLQQ